MATLRALAAPLAVATAVAALAVPVARASTGAAAATAITLPDLEVQVPTSAISIGTNPSTGHRQLQFTHVTWDAGTGPFAIQPRYDAATGLSSFRQVLYRRTGPAQWAPVRSVPLAPDGIFEAPSDYRYPLTRFALYARNGDGSLGALVATSPKVDYCITGDAYVGGVPNTPNQTSPPQSDCTDPNLLLGFSVGWGDQYDQTDNGQPIDLTGVPDGTYVLRAVVDPQHLFVASNRDNDVVDTVLTITGSNVTVGVQTHPHVVPPTVRVTSPRPSATVRSAVVLAAAAAATAPARVVSVRYLLDGEPPGPRLTTAPYRYRWATGPLPATHVLAAQVTDSNGMVGTSSVVTVHVARTRTPGLSIDAEAGAVGHGTLRTQAFSTSLAGDTLLAFCALDGPSTPGQTTTVSGAGLTWHLVRRANAQAGDAEVWTARAPHLLRRVRVTSTEHDGGFAQQLVVLALSGASGPGAATAASGASGAPAVTLRTTAARSDLFAIGSDWDQAIARTPHAGQVLLRQWVDTADGDTFWLQGPSAPVAVAGTKVVLGDTAPTSDRWDLAAVEVRAKPLASATAALVDPAGGETVSGTWPVAVDVHDVAAVTGVRLFVDGRFAGAARAFGSRAHVAWDTRHVRNGRHALVALVTDAAGRRVVATAVVDVTNPRPPMTCFVLSADVTASGSGRLATPRVHVASAGERLVALVGSSAGAAVGPVHAAGVTWRRLGQVRGRRGAVVIYTARAPTRLRTLVVTAAVAGGRGSLTLLAMEGTDGIGAIAPGVGRGASLTTTRPIALVVAVGTGRGGAKVPPGWASLSRASWPRFSTWVAYTDQPVARPGTRVQVPHTSVPGAVVLAVELPGDGG